MSARILLVSRDTVLMMRLQILLRDRYEVETAFTAVRAVELVATGRFDLVLAALKLETESAVCELLNEASKALYTPRLALLTTGETSHCLDLDAKVMLVSTTSDAAFLRDVALCLREDAAVRERALEILSHYEPPKEQKPN